MSKIYADAQDANVELYQFLTQLDTFVASVGSDEVLVIKATDTYPFNILVDYGKMLTDESDETVVKDLSYILSQLPEADRQALIDEITKLITAAGGGNAS